MPVSVSSVTDAVEAAREAIESAGRAVERARFSRRNASDVDRLLNQIALVNVAGARLYGKLASAMSASVDGATLDERTHEAAKTAAQACRSAAAASAPSRGQERAAGDAWAEVVRQYMLMQRDEGRQMINERFEKRTR